MNTPFIHPHFTGSIYVVATDINDWWKVVQDKPFINYLLYNLGVCDQSSEWLHFTIGQKLRIQRLY